MTRIVLNGEPDKFLKVTPNRLPDKVLDNSCFEHCDLSGLDLSGFTLRGVTLYRCLAKRVIFPPTWDAMEDFYSHCHYEGGDPRPYEGARIPADRPEAEQHDLVVEILFQAADKLGEPDASHIRALAELLQDYEHGCYETGVELLVRRTGSLEAAVTLLEPVFVPYPNLLRGFLQRVELVGAKRVR